MVSDETMFPWRGTQRVARKESGDTAERRATNDELALAVLPWAKKSHPDKYAQTISKAKDAATYRKFLLRLAEIMWQAEPGLRREFPLHVLEETAVRASLKLKNGTVISVAGRLAPGARQFSWTNLGMTGALEFQQLVETVQQGDFYVVEDGR